MVFWFVCRRMYIYIHGYLVRALLVSYLDHRVALSYFIGYSFYFTRAGPAYVESHARCNLHFRDSAF